MEIQYYGANCVRLTTKKASIIIDDNLQALGLNAVTKAGDIALFTGVVSPPKTEPKILISQPGEYEVSDVSIQGIAARSHMDEEGKFSATAFNIISEDMHVAVLGHIYPELSDSQLEAMGTIDVLVVPVGGNGYTLDSLGALKLIKEIEPKIVIPTHFDTKGITYEVPQQPLEEALKGLAMESVEPVAKLKLKPGDLPDTMQLIVLERQ